MFADVTLTLAPHMVAHSFSSSDMGNGKDNEIKYM
jgi:hypothetical protein